MLEELDHRGEIIAILWQKDMQSLDIAYGYLL